ncbi:hypothetical protein KPZU09_40250 [Klebsiella pneumoniae]|uniref:Uncharacterized protein n=1 Tax=Klebsiella pneumoniae TaxID=573 RepID=A0A919HY26_KLEPN|nr:hypothetical protein KPZU09_40250 [Klebsiella pneumoniae]
MKAISIFNRRDKFFANAEETVAKIRHNTDCEIHLFDLDDHDKLRAEIDSSVILTNATGVGMKPFEGQMLLPDDSFLRPDLIVSDVVYNPRKTHLLEVAEKRLPHAERPGDDAVARRARVRNLDGQTDAG